MDTSFLNPNAISWPSLIACGLALIALMKELDWLVNRSRADAEKAVSSLTVDMVAVKIQLASQSDQLNAFEIEVARTYVTGDVITRLERRVDDMVSSVREEMRETR